MNWNKVFIIASLMMSTAMLTSGYEGEDQGLKVETTFKPNNCDEHRKSKSGDELESLHGDNRQIFSNWYSEKFDSSHDRDQSFHFTLGLGQVIKGWDYGLVDMCVGEKRTLVIPSTLGYGDRAMGDDIPAKATLRFEVEALSIKEGKP